MSLLDGVTVRPSGEEAVVLEFGTDVDPAVHDRVLAVDAALRSSVPVGVTEVVPTYRSLLLHLDPDQVTPDEVVAILAERPAARPRAAEPTVHDVPVSFVPGHAEDLDEVAARLQLAPAGVVAHLTAGPLRVYCYGFVPGFPYLGGLPPSLHLPRRSTPRRPVSPGAVIVAAGQAALCPVAMPTGWWVVGRTTRSLFDAETDPPVPFAPGDLLQLVAVDA